MTDVIVNVAVDAALIEAANHAHVALQKADHLHSYTGATHVNPAGHVFAVSSGRWTAAQIAALSDPEIIAGLDLPAIVDPDKLAVAQAAIRVTTGPALVGKINVMIGPEGIAAVSAFDLTAIPPTGPGG